MVVKASIKRTTFAIYKRWNLSLFLQTAKAPVMSKLLSSIQGIQVVSEHVCQTAVSPKVCTVG